MGYKMKGFGGFKEESPAKQKDKKVIGENTGEIKKDKKGNEYALSMYDNASGINQGDTLFVSPKIPRVDDYVMGGDYTAEETESSKKRKKGPRSYKLKE